MLPIKGSWPGESRRLGNSQHGSGWSGHRGGGTGLGLDPVGLVGVSRQWCGVWKLIDGHRAGAGPGRAPAVAAPLGHGSGVVAVIIGGWITEVDRGRWP